MHAVTWSAVRARLDAAAVPGGVIACDGDGTLWRPDVGDRFAARWWRRGRIRDDALGPLQRLARSEGLPVADTARAQLRVVGEAWLAGRLGARSAQRAGVWMLAGASCAEVRAVAESTVAASAFAVAPGWRLLAGWAAERGIAVHVVSAGAQPIAEVAAARLGIPPAQVHGARGCTRDGQHRAALAGPLPWGHGKVDALRVAIGARPLVAAFGNDLPDRALLRAAAVGVAVAPTPALRRAAPELQTWAAWS